MLFISKQCQVIPQVLQQVGAYLVWSQDALCTLQGEAGGPARPALPKLSTQRGDLSRLTNQTVSNKQRECVSSTL